MLCPPPVSAPPGLVEQASKESPRLISSSSHKNGSAGKRHRHATEDTCPNLLVERQEAVPPCEFGQYRLRVLAVPTASVNTESVSQQIDHGAGKLFSKNTTKSAHVPPTTTQQQGAAGRSTNKCLLHSLALANPSTWAMDSKTGVAYPQGRHIR
jgi:hypothetical protein